MPDRVRHDGVAGITQSFQRVTPASEPGSSTTGPRVGTVRRPSSLVLDTGLDSALTAEGSLISTLTAATKHRAALRLANLTQYRMTLHAGLPRAAIHLKLLLEIAGFAIAANKIF